VVFFKEGQILYNKVVCATMFKLLFECLYEIGVIKMETFIDFSIFAGVIGVSHWLNFNN
jgi:hypothetical protein